MLTLQCIALLEISLALGFHFVYLKHLYKSLVDTKEGIFRGRLLPNSAGNFEILRFTIKYGEIKKRWNEAEAIQRKPSGLHHATEPAPSCPQNTDTPDTIYKFTPELFPNGYTKEDCLYVNLYVLASGLHNPKRYPVLAFFHGGGTDTGGSQIYNPSSLVETGEVIVVVPK